MPHFAFPCHRVSFRIHAVAYQNIPEPLHCLSALPISTLLQAQAFPIIANAPHTIANAVPICPMQLLCFSLHAKSKLFCCNTMHHFANLFRCIANRCYHRFSSAFRSTSQLFRCISFHIDTLLCLCASMLFESIAFQLCTQQICAIAVLSNLGQFHCAANRSTSCLSYSKACPWIALPLQHFVLLRFSIARPL